MLFRERVHRLTVYTLFEDTSADARLVIKQTLMLRMAVGGQVTGVAEALFELTGKKSRRMIVKEFNFDVTGLMAAQTELEESGIIDTRGRHAIEINLLSMLIGVDGDRSTPVLGDGTLVLRFGGQDLGE